MKELSELVKGDEVIIESFSRPKKLGLVERTTPTQLIIEGVHYRKKDGKAVGLHKFDPWIVLVAD